MGENESRSKLVVKPSIPATLSYVPLSPPQSQVLFNKPVITKVPPATAATAPPYPHRTTAFCTAAASLTRKRSPPVGPSPARKRATFPAENYGLPTELGECIHKDVELLQRVGWQSFVKTRRNGGDLADLSNVDDHPAKRLLMLYKHRGVPVKFSSPKWTRTKIKAALSRGAHKSCNEHIDFLN